MPKLEVLNPKEHDQLGILTDYLPQLGYGQGAVMVLPNEIINAQREYPLLFRKHPETGQLFLNALLGFEEKENLFLDGNGGWKGNYIPLAFMKGPFFINIQPDSDGQKAVMSIDMDDPRVSKEGGVKLFTDDGQATKDLERFNNILANMHHGMQQNEKMVEIFTKYELIEPVSLDITLENGKKFNFAGAYTVAQEKLNKLDSEALASLHASGFLSAAYYISDSVNNAGNLINFKNAAI